MDPASSMQMLSTQTNASGDGNVIMIAVLVVLIMLSAFFSGTETAFTSFNRTKMKTLLADGNKKAKAVMDVDDNYTKFISTMLVGNNIVNITATTISGLVFANFIKGDAGLAATLSTIVMTVVVLIFGEITPKNLAKDFAEGYVMATVGIVKFLMAILTPITAIFGLWRMFLGVIIKREETAAITEDEIMTMVDEAQEEGGIDEHEGDLIRSAIEFNDLEAAAILTPRVDIVAIEADWDISEVKTVFRENGFSRLPVYDDTIDNIIGVIHEKDFNRMLHDGKSDIRAVTHEVLFITEGMKISKLLREFQAAKAHMAIVVDEYGGTAGLITLEDVLEGLVGDIWDEHDEVIENIIPIEVPEDSEDKVYLINCSMPMMDLNDIREFDEDTLEDNATVNGWVLECLGKVPEVGDSFEYKNLEVEVTSIDGRRASEIKLTVHPVFDDEDEDDEKPSKKNDDDEDDDDESSKKSEKKEKKKA